MGDSFIIWPPRRFTGGKYSALGIFEMREVEKGSFIKIAEDLHMTQAKAKRTYEIFYHKQVLKLIEALQEKVESEEEKMAIMKYYFRENKSSKKRYDMLTKG